jgi:hypothetical protein
VNTRESFNVHQYYDFENKRVRTDVHDNGMMASTISDFGTKMRYMLINDLSSKDFFHEMNAQKDTKCIKESMAIKIGFEIHVDAFRSKTLHMKSPHESFMFSSTGAERYIGQDYARGVGCTQWFANATETEVVDGHTITIASQRNHWFSTPGWLDANCVSDGEEGCPSEIPIRTVSEGTIFNHSSKATTKFHDHYEYTGFMVGNPAPHLFTPDQQDNGNHIVCSKGNVQQEKMAIEALVRMLKPPSPSAGASHAPLTPDAKYKQKSRPMPSLPQAYSAVLEISRVESQSTTTVFENFDFNAQRVRTDVHANNQMVTTIRDYNSKAMYTIVDPDCGDDPFTGYSQDDKCLTSEVAEEALLPSAASPTRHLKSPSDVFMFSGTGDERYVGEDYARGIKCSQWYAESEETYTLGGHSITVKTVRNHWFSSPDWSDAGCAAGNSHCRLEVPVRIVAEGTVTNGTSAAVEKFHDHYEYMAFVAGKPPAYVFAPAMQCEGVSSGSSEEGKDNSMLPGGGAPSKAHVPEQMPALPSSYSVVVEVNRVEQLESLTVSQYIDAGNRRVRSDVHDDGRVVSVIRDFGTGS